MASIVIESGPRRGRRLRLPESGVLGIGRDAKCAVRLSDGMVSRVHCLLRGKNGRWVLEDRKSRNGTFVNDTPVTKKLLASGDMLRVGDTLLFFTTEAADRLLGTTVGGCQIEAHTGRGASGTVYEAVQLSLKRTVALKILAPRFAQNPAFIRRFLEEARAAARLNHPNLVQVYDAGEDQGRYYITMEYVAGGTIEELLAQRQDVEVETVLHMGIDAAQALSYAEERGIVHRDIKPANLLIGSNGTVKICDLGIALDLGASSGDSARPAGSPRYMAPEQIDGNGVIDHRADIYALGATLYRMLAGQPPHDGATTEAILAAKLRTDPTPLRDLVPEIPATIANTVMRMIARSPDDRYANAVQVQKALHRCLGAVGRSRKGDRGRSPVSRRGAIRREKSKRSLVLGVAALIPIVAVVAVLMRDPPNAGDVVLQRDALEADRLDGGASEGDLAKREVSRSADRASRTSRVRRVDRKSQPARTGNLVDRVASVRAAFRTGELTRKQADAQLRTLRDRYAASQAVREAVDAARAEIADAAAKSTARSVQQLETKVRSLVALESWKDAHKAIVDFETDDDEILADAQKLLDASVAEALAKAESEVANVTNVQAAETVRTTLTSLASRLPKRSAERVKQLQVRLKTVENSLTRKQQDFERTRLDVWKAVARLELDEAGDLLASLDGTASPPQEQLVRQFKLARSTWEGLRHAVQAKLAAEEEWTIALASGRRKTARTVGLSGPTMRLQLGKEKFETHALLSLTTATLRELVSSQPGASQPDVDEGLGLLLLLRRGPKRAEELLSSRPAAGTDDNPALLDLARAYWLPGRAHSARVSAGLLPAPDGATAVAATGDSWRFLVSEATLLIKAWSERDDFDAVQAELGELYVKAHSEGIMTRPKESFFHAKKTKFHNEGQVSLSYDFSAPAQLQDFFTVGKRGVVECVKSNKCLRLRGEIRFLRGIPFKGFLAVRGMAPKGGFLEASPNVNLALWTREDDMVSSSRVGQLDPDDDDDSSALGSDYFVLAHGYRATLAARVTSSTSSYYDETKLPKFCFQPTFALIAGTRGLPLHQSVIGEVIWELPINNRLRNGVDFAAVMDGGDLRWTVQRAALPIQSSPDIDRLREIAPHSGSVTFFTNRSTVMFARLEIRGRLREEWYRERAQSLAGEDLKRLDGSVFKAWMGKIEEDETESDEQDFDDL